MMPAVVDTNVLLIANAQHADVCFECVASCVQCLQALQRSGVIVIDDGFRILGEYQNKTTTNPPKGVGDVFLKWLLRNTGSVDRVHVVQLTETADSEFDEFPDQSLQARFDPPDRKFVAVANAHPQRPRILQAADSKWLEWWSELATHGVAVSFLCPTDMERFYRSKFPDKPVPRFP